MSGETIVRRDGRLIVPIDRSRSSKATRDLSGARACACSMRPSRVAADAARWSGTKSSPAKAFNAMDRLPEETPLRSSISRHQDRSIPVGGIRRSTPRCVRARLYARGRCATAMDARQTSDLRPYIFAEHGRHLRGYQFREGTPEVAELKSSARPAFKKIAFLDDRGGIKIRHEHAIRAASITRRRKRTLAHGATPCVHRAPPLGLRAGRARRRHGTRRRPVVHAASLAIGT